MKTVTYKGRWVKAYPVVDELVIAGVRVRWCVPIGFKRPPRKGELYLSGAVVEGYVAPNDLSSEYAIAEPVLTQLRLDKGSRDVEHEVD